MKTHFQLRRHAYQLRRHAYQLRRHAYQFMGYSKDEKTSKIVIFKKNLLITKVFQMLHIDQNINKLIRTEKFYPAYFYSY